MLRGTRAGALQKIRPSLLPRICEGAGGHVRRRVDDYWARQREEERKMRYEERQRDREHRRELEHRKAPVAAAAPAPAAKVK